MTKAPLENIFSPYGLTPETYLKERIDNGKSHSEIAAQYHISPGTISHKVATAKKANWWGATHPLVQPVIDALKGPETYSEIARELNISKKVVKNIASDFCADRKFSIDAFQDFLAKGYTRIWIADYYGITTVYLGTLVNNSQVTVKEQIPAFSTTIGEIIGRLYAAGVSVEIIAASFGFPSSAIKAYLVNNKTLTNISFDTRVEEG